MDHSGVLYVIATPIGNMGDLSTRAREMLEEADLVAAEDTRHTGRLLNRLGLARPMLSLHEHNERDRVAGLIERLRDGARIALVSDAGTPLVSDPGYRLLSAARDADIRVVPVPGPCAAIAALSVAGLPSDRFAFEGFLPARQVARLQRLEGLASEQRTLIFYESARRLGGVLSDMLAAFGATRRATVAREMTKTFETIWHGTLPALLARAAETPESARGELTLVVEGAEDAKDSVPGLDVNEMLRALLAELPPRRAAAVAAKLTGRKRNDLYRAALALGERD